MIEQEIKRQHTIIDTYLGKVAVYSYRSGGAMRVTVIYAVVDTKFRTKNMKNKTPQTRSKRLYRMLYGSTRLHAPGKY